MILRALLIGMSIISSVSGMILPLRDPKAQECAQRVDCVVHLIGQGADREAAPLVHHLEDWYAVDPVCASICLHPTLFEILSTEQSFTVKRNALWLRAKSLATLWRYRHEGLMIHLFMNQYFACIRDLFFKNPLLREQILGTFKLFKGEEFSDLHPRIRAILADIMLQAKHVWVQNNMTKLADCQALFAQ